MSLSPSLPPGAPSLAEVLIQRTFEKPTQPFVDGEFIEALSHADDDRPSVAAAAAASAQAATADDQRGTGTGAPAAHPQAAAPAAAPAAPQSGSKIDVRA
jgi:hypothetical protein